MTFTLTAPLTATEGELYSFDITRAGALSAAVTIRWEIALIGATPATSSDFSSLTGTVVFAIGETTKTVTFTPTNDAIREVRENFELRIYNVDDDSTPLETQAVTLVDANAPVITSSEGADITLPEGTATTEAVTTLTVADDDTGYSWVLGGEHAAAFVFDEVTGEIKWREEPDFETQTIYIFTVTVTDDDSTTPLSGSIELIIRLTDVNEAPELVRAAVAANAGETVVLDTTHLLTTDVDDSAAELTYTVTALASTGVLQLRTGDGSAGNPYVWTERTTTAGNNNDNEFTQADVNGENVRFVADASRGDAAGAESFTLLVADGGPDNTQPIEVTLSAEIREDTTVVNKDEANTVNAENEAEAQNIETGDGQDDIADGQGNDRIEGGLGDDTITLGDDRRGDEIIFRFGANGVAVDGGDKINNFKRGEDKLVFTEATEDSTDATDIDEFFTSVRNGDAASARVGASYTTGDLQEDLFILTPNFELDDNGVFFITGITFNFRDVGLFDSNTKLAGGLLSLTFNTPLTWDAFSAIVGADSIDFNVFAFKDPATITTLLGEDSFEFRPYAEQDAVGVVTITHAETSLPLGANVGEVLTADVSDLTDENGDIVSYAYVWSATSQSGITSSFVTDGETFNTTVLVGGTHTVTVTVTTTDANGGTTVHAPASITVVDGALTTGGIDLIDTSVTGDVLRVNSAENQDAVATLTADVNAPTGLLWSLDEGADSGLFTITPDAQTGAGVITWVNEPDYETLNSANGDKEFRVVVTATDPDDELSTDRVIVIITLTDGNDAPSITSSDGTEIDSAENQQTVTTLSVSDDTTVADGFTWTLTGDDADLFTITRDDATGEGVITWRDAPDFETTVSTQTDTKLFRVTATVMDDDGTPLQDSINLEIRLENVNETPIIVRPSTNIALTSAGLATVTSGASAYRGGSDATEAIQIAALTDGQTENIEWGNGASITSYRPRDAAGEVLAFDFGTNSYAQGRVVIHTRATNDSELQIHGSTVQFWLDDDTVGDAITIESDEAVDADTAVFTITPPTDLVFDEVQITFANADQQLAEVEIFGHQVVESAENTQPDTAITTLSVDDADMGDTENLRWSLEDADSLTADARFFNINDDGEITWKAAPDFETTESAAGDKLFRVTAIVTDDDTEAPLTDSIDVVIKLTDVNEAPVISHNGEVAEGTTITVDSAENQPVALAEGVLTAADDDVGDGFSWRLNDANVGDARFFNIDSQTGVITWKEEPDFETTRSANDDTDFRLNVRAAPTSGSENSGVNVIVRLTDANDAPFVTLDGEEVADGVAIAVESAENQDAVITLTADDVDASDAPTSLRWSLTGGADVDMFNINARTGAITWKVAPDFEKTESAANDGVFRVTARVRDDDGTPLQDSINVEITLTDASEAPVFAVDVIDSFTGRINVNAHGVRDNTRTPNVDESGGVFHHTVTLSTGGFYVDINEDAVAYLPDGTVLPITIPDDMETSGRHDITTKNSLIDSYIWLEADTVNVGQWKLNNGPSLDGLTAGTFYVLGLFDAYDFIFDHFGTPADNVRLILGEGADKTIDLAESQDAEMTIPVFDVDESNIYAWSLTANTETPTASEHNDLFDIDSTTGAITWKPNTDFNNIVGGDEYRITVTVTDGDHPPVSVNVIITAINANNPPIIDRSGITLPDTEPTNIAPSATITTSVGTTYVDGADEADQIAFLTDGETLSDGIIFEVPGGSTNSDANGYQPNNADGKFLSFAFDTAHVQGEVLIHNRGGSNSFRIDGGPNGNGSTLQFLLNDEIVGNGDDADNEDDNDRAFTLHSRNQDSDSIITVTPPADLVFDEVRIVFAGNSQNLAEIEIFGVEAASTLEVNAAENAENLVAVAASMLTATDTDGNEGLAWSLTGGADVALFAINEATGEIRWVDAPNYEAYESDEDRVFRVTATVTDPTGLTDSINIEITLTDGNDAPMIIEADGVTIDSSQNLAVDANENRLAITTLTATDDDAGDSFTWSLTGGAHMALFNIDSGGVLRWVTAPDYESFTRAADRVFHVTATATASTGDDRTLSDSIDLTVTVQDVNESPVILLNDNPITTGRVVIELDENERAMTTFTATDDRTATENIRWSLSSGSNLEGDERYFDISNTGVVTWKEGLPLPDYEDERYTRDVNPEDRDFTVVVQATDNENLSRTITLQIELQNVDEAPVITRDGTALADGTAITVSSDENQRTVTTLIADDSDGNTLSWVLEETGDHALFEITSDGVLTWKATNPAPDFETTVSMDSTNNKLFHVTATVRDGATDAAATLTDSVNLEITLDDVNDAPVIDTSAAVTPANIASLAAITSSVTQYNPDLTDRSMAQIENLRDGNTAVGRTDWGTGTTEGYHPRDADGKHLTFKFEDDDYTHGSVVIHSRETNLARGYIEGSTLQFRLDDVVVHTRTLRKADYDVADSTLTVTLPNDANGNPRVFDEVRITFANDRQQLEEIEIFGVSTTMPTLRITSAENDPAVFDLNAMDNDNDMLTWSLTGDDVDLFTIDSATGAITWETAPDYETLTSASDDKVFRVTATVSDRADATALTDSIHLEVTLTDANDAPVMSIPDSEGVTYADGMGIADGTMLADGAAIRVTSAENQDAVINLDATDDDGGSFVWQLFDLNEQESTVFDISDDGEITWKVAPDYEDERFTRDVAPEDRVFHVTATATDNDSTNPQSSSVILTVELTDVDDAPVIDEEPLKLVAGVAPPLLAIEVAENIDTVIDLAAADDNGGGIRWADLSGADANRFNINTETGEIRWAETPDFEDASLVSVAGTKVFQVVAFATNPDGSDTISFSIILTNVNDAPVISIPDDITALMSAENERAVTTLSATDDEGDAFTWSLEETGDHALFSIDSAGVITWIAAPDFETLNSEADSKLFSLTATATDANDDSVKSSIDLTVRLTDANEAPIIILPANIASLATVTPYDDATYRGGVGATEARQIDALTDGDTGQLTPIVWSGAGITSYRPRDADGETLTFDFGTDSYTQGSVVIHTRATGNGISERQIHNSMVQFWRDGTAVGEALTITSTAAVDADTAVFTVTLPNDENGNPQVFDQVQITFAGEDQQLAEVEIFAIPTDRELTAAEIALFAAGESLAVESQENQPITMPVTTLPGVVDDAGDTFRWSLLGVDAGLFAIGVTTGEIRWVDAPDFETTTSFDGDRDFEITAIVTDGEPGDANNLRDSIAITVTLTNENEAPVIDTLFTGRSQFVNGINTADGVFHHTAELTLIAQDGGFVIEVNEGARIFLSDGTIINIPSDAHTIMEQSTGLSYVWLEADTANAGEWLLNSGALPASGEGTAFFRLGEFNNDTHIFLAYGNIVTDTPLDTLAFELAEQVDAVIPLVVSDVDTSDSHTWTLGGADADNFDIDSMTGAISWAANTDFDTIVSGQKYAITATVSDRADATALTDSVDIIITATHVGSAPVITSAGTAGSITSLAPRSDENQLSVVDLDATDVDGDGISWALTGGADIALFDIDENTGVVTWKTAPDYENLDSASGNKIFSVMVTATDDTGLQSDVNLAITLDNINDAPDIAITTLTLVENQAMVSTPIATDDDAGDRVSWSLVDDTNNGLTSADNHLFNINPRWGFITWVGEELPDYETTRSADGDREFLVRVRVSDGSAGGVREVPLTISLTDVNEAPVITRREIVLEDFIGRTDASVSGFGDAHGRWHYTAPITSAGATDSTAATITIGEGGFAYLPNGDVIEMPAGSVTFRPATDTRDSNPNIYFAQRGDGTWDYLEDSELTQGLGAFFIANAPGTGTFYAPRGIATTWTHTADIDSTGREIAVASGTLITIPSRYTDLSSKIATLQGGRFTFEEGDDTIWLVPTEERDLSTILEARIWTYATGPVEVEGALFGEGLPLLQFDTATNRYVPYAEHGEAVTAGGTTTITAPLTVTIPVRIDSDENTAPDTTVVDLDARDVDVGDTANLRWSLAGEEARFFDIDEETGVITWKEAPDFESSLGAETAKTFRLAATVTDDDPNNPLSSTLSFSVWLTDVNEVPTVTLLDAAAVTTLIDDVAVTVANGAEIADGTELTVESAENQDAVITLRGLDEDSSSSTARSLPNSAGTVIWTVGGSDADLFEVTPMPGIVRIGGLGLQTQDIVITWKEAPDFETASQRYNLVVTASDDTYDIRIPLVIRVTDVNDAPIIDDTPAGAVFEGQLAAPIFESLENQSVVGVLTATDIESNSISWELSGADEALFDINNRGVITWDADPDFESTTSSNGDRLFSLTATARDRTDASATDVATDSIDVIVRLTDRNDAPVITEADGVTVDSSETLMVMTPENLRAVVDLDAMDDDGDTLSWRFSSSGSDRSFFDIDRATGEITWLELPDFEDARFTSADGDRDFHLTVTVQERASGRLEDAIDITITLENDEANERPVFTQPTLPDGTPVSSGVDFNAPRVESAENQDAVITLSATDYEGTAITWSLVDANSPTADARLFNIDAMTGVVTWREAPDFETLNSEAGSKVFSLTATATDADPTNPQESSLSLTVTLTDANEAPVIPGGSRRIDVFENSFEIIGMEGMEEVMGVTFSATDVDMGDTENLKWSLDTTDTMLGSRVFLGDYRFFNIDEDTGEIRWAGDRFTGYRDINANGVPDNPSTSAVDESGGVFHHTATLSTTGGEFQIDVSEGAVAFLPDGSIGKIQSGVHMITTQGSSTNSYVWLEDPNDDGIWTLNHAPIADDGSGFPTSGTFYALGTFDSQDFVFNYLGTEITSDSSAADRTIIPPADYETTRNSLGNRLFSLTARVTDPEGATDTVNIAITLRNVDEAPVLAQPTLPNNMPVIGEDFTAPSVESAENQDGVIDLDATDPEGTDITWGLGTTGDSDLFEISVHGVVTWKTDPDYDTLDSADGDKVFRVAVTATDGDGGGVATEIALTVTLTNVFENTVLGAIDSSRFDTVPSAATPTNIAPDDATNVETSVTVFRGGVGATEARHIAALTDGNTGLPDEETGLTTNIMWGGGAAITGYNARNTGGQTLTFELDGDYTQGRVEVYTRATPNGNGERRIHNTEVQFRLDGENVGDPIPIDSMTDVDADIAKFTVTPPVGLVFDEVLFTFPSNSDGSEANQNIAEVEIFAVPTALGVTSAENLEVVTTLTAVDIDPSSLTWTLTGGADAGSFDLSETGELRWVNTPDFETTMSAAGSKVFSLTATVRDSLEAEESISFLVTLTDVNEHAPIIDQADGAIIMSLENQDTVTMLTATDMDTLDTLTWSLTDDASGLFTIDDETGAITWMTEPDFEDSSYTSAADRDFSVTAQVTDGTNTDSITLTIRLTNANEAPVIPGGSPPSIDANENVLEVVDLDATDVDMGDTENLKWSLAETGDRVDRNGNLVLGDYSFFNINDDGVITWAENPDYETARSSLGNKIFTLSVVVRDRTDENDETALMHSIGVGIFLRDVNEGPPIIDQTDGALIMSPENQLAVTRLTAMDIDTFDTLTWSLTDDASGLFAIDSMTGAITWVTALDYEDSSYTSDADRDFSVTAQVTDGTNTDSITLTIRLANEDPLYRISDSSVAATLDASGRDKSQIQGGDEGDTIIASAHGDTILGGGGDDIITLGDGADSVVYRWSSGSTATATDGEDTIRNFDIGVDQFIFIDEDTGTMVTSLAGFIDYAKGVNENNISDDLITFAFSNYIDLGAADPRRIDFNSMEIVFGTEPTSDRITIEFDAPLSSIDLHTIFGTPSDDLYFVDSGALTTALDPARLVYFINADYTDNIAEVLGGTDTFESLDFDEDITSLGFDII